MLTASFRRKTILLLLAAILAVPTASAAAPRIEVPTPDRSTHSAPLELLGRALSFLRSAWSKEGCDINPNGHCTKGTPQPPPTKTGCDINPFGQCHP